MKKTFNLIFLLFLFNYGFSQENLKNPEIIYDLNGNAEFINFHNVDNDSKPISDYNLFLQKYLDITEDNKLIPCYEDNYSRAYKNPVFKQYYKGILVVGAKYVIHSKNGKLVSAHGHFVKIENMSVEPKITEEESITILASSWGVPTDSIYKADVKLVIGEFSSTKNSANHNLTLAYKVYLKLINSSETLNAYVDANSGNILLFNEQSSFIGNFDTRYSGFKTGETSQDDDDNYILLDETRGGGIHVKDMKLGTNRYASDDITDSDNDWEASEYHANNFDAALDVLWALQNIFDYIFEVYDGIEGVDGYGAEMNAYIRYGTLNKAEFMDSENIFAFGVEDNYFDVLTSFDIVAHEYGHAFGYRYNNWEEYYGNYAAIHEGFADIWSLILSYRLEEEFNWLLGEQVSKVNSCVRNIENPMAPTAYYQLATTYGSDYYNDSQDPFDSRYIRGGVFSHWFYLLVNGGSGVNGVGNNYTVNGIGMDMAEKLVAFATFDDENYLESNNDYGNIRDGFVAAAQDMGVCNNELIVQSVENAWYAVGVGSSSSQHTISGPSLVCSTGSTFYVLGLPAGCSITNWDYSTNLTPYYGGSNSISLKAVNGAGSVGWVTCTIKSSCGEELVNILPKTTWVGVPSNPITSPTGYPTYQMILGQYENISVSSAPGASNNIYNWNVTGSIDRVSTTPAMSCTVEATELGIGNFYVTSSNACGTSFTGGGMVYVSSGGGGGHPQPLSITPNPASTEIAVSIVESSAGENIFIQSNSSESKSSESPAEFDLTVYNNFSLPVYNAKVYGDKFNINVSGWFKGLYHIIIIREDKKYSGSFIVK